MDEPLSSGSIAPKNLGNDEAFQRMLAELSARLASRVVQPRPSLNKPSGRRGNGLAQRTIKAGIIMACIAIGSVAAYDVYRATTPAEAGPGFLVRQVNSAISLLHLHEELPFTGRRNISTEAQLSEKLHGTMTPPEQGVTSAPKNVLSENHPTSSTEESRPASPIPRSAIDDTSAALKDESGIARSGNFNE